METHDQRDMEADESKDGRPPMEVQLAEEKPMEDPSNSNPAHSAHFIVMLSLLKLFVLLQLRALPSFLSVIFMLNDRHFQSTLHRVVTGS